MMSRELRVREVGESSTKAVMQSIAFRGRSALLLTKGFFPNAPGS